MEQEDVGNTDKVSDSGACFCPHLRTSLCTRNRSVSAGMFFIDRNPTATGAKESKQTCSATKLDRSTRYRLAVACCGLWDPLSSSEENAVVLRAHHRSRIGGVIALTPFFT